MRKWTTPQPNSDATPRIFPALILPLITTCGFVVEQPPARVLVAGRLLEHLYVKGTCGEGYRATFYFVDEKSESADSRALEAKDVSRRDDDGKSES
jgi:hypothetical protein